MEVKKVNKQPVDSLTDLTNNGWSCVSELASVCNYG